MAVFLQGHRCLSQLERRISGGPRGEGAFSAGAVIAVWFGRIFGGCFMENVAKLEISRWNVGMMGSVRLWLLKADLPQP